MTDMNNEDRELAEIFSGEEKPLHPDTVHITLGGRKVEPKPYEAPKAKDKPVTEQWEPKKPAPDWKDKLISCCKWAGLFGGLSFLIFYWQESGLMAESIAVPCIAICTALAGWGVGISWAGGKQ
jgi:hypothetical protein